MGTSYQLSLESRFTEEPLQVPTGAFDGATTFCHATRVSSPSLGRKARLLCRTNGSRILFLRVIPVIAALVA